MRVTYSVELLEATINKQVDRIEALEAALRIIEQVATSRCARIEALEADLKARDVAATPSEPVAWRVRYCGQFMFFEDKPTAEFYAQEDDNAEPLYTAPAQASDRIEALEAALREIAERSWHPANAPMGDIARAALAPEQDK